MTDPQPGNTIALQKRLKHLRSSEKLHLEVVQRLLQADSGNMFSADLVIMACAQRSLELIDGFCLLIERRNLICAAPLIRMQLDSVMKVVACQLGDANEVALALLGGKGTNKLLTREKFAQDGKGKNGRPLPPVRQQLTDSFLHRQLSASLPWASRVYEATSRFVHLSSPHMHSVVTDLGPDRAVEFGVGRGAGRQVKEEELLEAVDAFIAATEGLFQLSVGWLSAKEHVATQRKAPSPTP